LEDFPVNGFSLDAGIEKNGASASSALDRRGRLPWAKGFAGVFSVLMIGATLSPVVENWREDPKDNFPLSYYPMFSAKRSENYQVNYIVGLDTQGNRHLISHKFAGSGGFNQTRRQINKVVREKQADELCRSIAAKVARQEKSPYAEIVTVQIVTGTYRFADYFAGNKTPLSERVRASCPVPRGES
jgi:hypothetical protein